jgi:NitT/TauT family transport system substrate-binding protein
LIRKLVLAVLGAATLLAAPARAEDLPQVKLGLNKLGAMADVWYAAQAGIFKKHGVDVQIVDIPMSSQSMLVLKSKAVDIALQIPGTAMVAKEQGFDLVLVGQNETAGITPPVSNALMIPVNSPVQKLADLKGKRIASSSPRGQGFAALKEVFQRGGLPIDAVQLMETPFTAVADLLRSGQVDAAVALDPYTTQIIKAGWGKPLSWYMVETIPDQPVGAWWAMRPWAQAHPKEIAAFNAGVKDVIAQFKADPELGRRAVSDYSGLDPALVKEMPPISWKADIDPAVWQALIDLMYRQGELGQKHDVSEYLIQQSASR